MEEEDAEERFVQVKGACKIITMLMPYQNRLKKLTHQKDILFLLLLLEIFNKKTVIILIARIFIENRFK